MLDSSCNSSARASSEGNVGTIVGVGVWVDDAVGRGLNEGVSVTRLVAAVGTFGVGVNGGSVDCPQPELDMMKNKLQTQRMICCVFICSSENSALPFKELDRPSSLVQH